MAPYFGQKSALLQELAVDAYSPSDYSSELTAFQPEFQERDYDKSDTRLPKKPGQPIKQASRRWLPIKEWRKYVKSQCRNRQARKGKAKGKGKD